MSPPMLNHSFPKLSKTGSRVRMFVLIWEIAINGEMLGGVVIRITDRFW